MRNLLATKRAMVRARLHGHIWECPRPGEGPGAPDEARGGAAHQSGRERPTCCRNPREGKTRQHWVMDLGRPSPIRSQHTR